MVLVRQIDLNCPDSFFKAVRVSGQLSRGCNQFEPMLQMRRWDCFGPSPTCDETASSAVLINSLPSSLNVTEVWTGMQSSGHSLIFQNYIFFCGTSL